MKTAQGSISIDVSKFNSGIENAKAKLSSFGQSLVKIGQVATAAFESINSISAKIITISTAFDILKSAFNSAPSVFNAVRTQLSKLGQTFSQIIPIISQIPTPLKVLGVVAVTTTVSIYGVVKAIQVLAGVTKSAVSGVASIASGLGNMAKSASTAVSGAVLSGFRGLLNVLKPIGLAVGGLGVAFGALDRFFKIGITSAIEMGDEMKNLSARTGASIPFLVDFQKILKNSGVSGMTGAVAIQNLQRALTGINADGEPTNDMIKRLGLNLDEMANMTEEQKVLQTGIAIMKLGNASERTTASFAMFGRAGASMNAVFQDPAFLELGTKQSQLGISLAKNADNFSKISAKLRDSGSFFRGFFVEMAGAVAPSILEIFKLFEGNDMLTGFGAKLGEQIRFGLEVLIGAFKSGMIFDLLKASFEASGVILEDLLQRSFTFASNLLKKLLEADVSTAVLSGIGSAIVGSLSIIAGTLVKAFATPIAYLQAGIQTAFESSLELLATKLPAVASLMGFGGFKGSGMEANFAERKAGVSTFADETITAGFENIASGVTEAVKGATDSFNILKNSLTEFPAQGEKAKNVTSEIAGQLSAIAIAGKASAQAIGEVAGSEVLGAKTGKSTSGRGGASDAVSSLRRIGGGGSAFTADPMIKESQKQTSVIEKVVKLVEPISKKASEYQLMPSMSQQGMVGAFLS
jgi:hypothetical protein